MVIVHNLRKRKSTGGRYKSVYPKRLAQKGTKPVLTRIGEKTTRTRRTLGGNSKRTILTGNKVNLIDIKSKKSSVVELKRVIDNTAARQYVRRNILTKGAIIDTSKGKAQVTNRPGQDGSINAVLVKE